MYKKSRRQLIARAARNGLTPRPQAGLKRKSNGPSDTRPGKRVRSVAAILSVGTGAGADGYVTSTSDSLCSDENSQTAVVPTPLKNPDACLSALPMELLNNVAEHLPRCSLFRLSLMSKRLNGIFLSLLYARGLNSKLNETSRRSFIHMISKRPELAKLVKSIEAKSSIYTVDWSELKAVRERNKKGPKLHKVVNGVDLTGRNARLLDLALTSAINVEQLSIAVDKAESTAGEYSEQNFWWIDLLVNASRGTPVGPTKKYLGLRSLEISCSIWVHGWLRLEKLSPILRLPSLERVTLKGFVESKRISNWGCPEQESKIKELELKACFLDSDVIVQLISSCMALQKFSSAYDAQENWSPFEIDENHPKRDWAEHSWPPIAQALQRHKDSLQVLNLSYNPDPELISSAREWGAKVIPQSLGSLRDFGKLERLAVPIDALFTRNAEPARFSDNLPEKLQSLDLRIDENTEMSPTVCGAALQAFKAAPTDLHLKCFHLSIGMDTRVRKWGLSKPDDLLKMHGVRVVVTRSRKHKFDRFGQLVKEIHRNVQDKNDIDDTDEEYDETSDEDSEDDD